jgi:hypothetical protein
VSGFSNKAVMRWRLASGDWRLERLDNCVRLVDGGEGVGFELVVRATVPIIRAELLEGWESRFYMDKAPTPVLEVEVREECTLFTEFRWKND